MSPWVNDFHIAEIMKGQYNVPDCVWIGPAWAVPMDVGGQFSGTVTGVVVMAGDLAASGLRRTLRSRLLGRSVLRVCRCDVRRRAHLDASD